MLKLHYGALSLALVSLLATQPAAFAAPNLKCSKAQQRISAQIETDTTVDAAKHVAKNFVPKGSYLVNDYVYKNYVKGKAKLGRPVGGESFLFVAGGKFIDGVLAAAKKNGIVDYTVIEKKLGLPTGTYKPEGGLWRVDVTVKNLCYRLPKADDPGANSDFKAGGYTSGGVPEILVINGRASYAANIVKLGLQKAPPKKKGP